MKNNIRQWFLIILTFTVALYIYAVFSYFSIENFVEEGILKDYFDSQAWHIEVIVASIMFGTLFVLIDQLTEQKVFRRKSFGFNILFKSSLYLISLVLVCVVIYHSFIYFKLISKEAMDQFRSMLTVNFVLSGLLFYGSLTLFLNFILYINKKFGPGSLIDLLTGKYYHPQNEELIFLFLDLKGSTTLAEKLGHNTYSSFIKECVHELTPIIQKYQAKVYQYVGDEVVLFWEKKEGFHQQNCLNTFFDFTQILKQRKDYFQAKYGEIPEFKAGMDTGIVTATEIGDIKREIAFHGDVLNTAARLEKKCNEFNAPLIVTEHVAEQVKANHKYSFKFLSDLPLRGKAENVKFYAVVL
jgi:adenylate cyclase